MIRLVIFDFDGVLVDSKEAWLEAWKRAFAVLGVKLSRKEFEQECWGVPFPVVCMKRGFPSRKCSKARRVMLDSYLDSAEHVSVFRGVRELFASLESRGIKRALLTNVPKHVAEKVTEMFGLGFDAMPDLSKMPAKPSPAGIEAILDSLGIKKGEAVFVGDTETDAETGKNAGIKTYIVGRDVKSAHDVLKRI